jgi:hypothetical protein
MFKTIALIGLAALVLPPVAASAQTGTTSSYGSYGSGQRIPTQSLSNFDRQWNHFNESKERARASANWMRRHYYGHSRP